jgi:hypothetical protein
MNRQTSFYLMTTGICIYLIILSIFLFIPIHAFYLGTITTDQIIGTALITITFFPVSFLAIYNSSKYLKVVDKKRVFPLLITPYVITGIVCLIWN